MPVFKQYTENSYRWGIWKTSESLEEMLALLPHKGKYEEGIGKFAAGSRRLEWLAVRVLLYTMLGEEKEIRYYSNGKPYLADGSFSISISHTKGYVAVILSSVAPVGIDIEQYGQRVKRVYDRFIRSDERVEPYQGDETWSMLLHWSAKETIFKSMENADADLRKLCLSHFIPQSEGVFQVREYATERQQLFTVGYHICPDFVLTWTVTI